jgi:ATP-dependent DNA helicase RecG
MLGMSVCRNPKLANIFHRLTLIEAYGTCIKKIFNAYKGTNLEPKIEKSKNGFKVTLPSITSQFRNSLIKSQEQESTKIIKEKPTSNEGIILQLVNKNGFVTRVDIEKALGVSQSTANRLIKN